VGLPQNEIEVLTLGLEGGVRAVPDPDLGLRRHVRVKSGPTAGMNGILLRR
jgi:hypothetical protein